MMMDSLFQLDNNSSELCEQDQIWNRVDDDLRVARRNHQCNICGNVGTAIMISKLPTFDWSTFFSGDLDLRESLVCIVCGSSSRARMLIWQLGKYLNESSHLARWKEDKNIKMLETPGLWPHPKYLKEKFDYYDNFPGPNGSHEKFLASCFANLESLYYQSEFFDFVLSSDALEHIRKDDTFLGEVYRVLKKGGKFLLQVPYCDSWKENHVKVKSDDKKDIFLDKPEYHADNSLVYRIYGKELLSSLKQIGFSVDYVCTKSPESMISLQPIIICTK